MQTKFQQGTILHRQGRLADAERLYEEVLRREPRHFDALHMLGIIAFQTRRAQRGVELIRQAIRLSPNDAAKYTDLAMGLVDLKLFDEALANYDKAIALRPDFADAHFNRGNALSDMKRFDEALSSYDKAVALKPDFAAAHNNRGNTLQQLKRFAEAIASYDKAIALRPDLVVTHNSRGNALKALRRFDDALASYDKAIAAKPDFAEALYNRGNTLKELKRFQEALASYDKAIALKPDYARAHYGRGSVQVDLKLYEEAIASFSKALALNPNLAEAWLGRGKILYELRRYDETLAAVDEALALNPGLAEAWADRGKVLYNLKRYDQAVVFLDKALTLSSDITDLEGVRLHAKMYLCDWSNFNAECAHLISSVQEGKINSLFPLLAIPSSSADQLLCAKQWVAHNRSTCSQPLWQGERHTHDRIRVAYLSPDFRRHPVGEAVVGYLERHDRSRFETIGLSIGEDDGSSTRARIVQAFDQFHDFNAKSDIEAATFIREPGVDIAVELAPHTEGTRPGILALRPAPIQVNSATAWTSGADYLDYVLADPRALPFDEQPYFPERNVHLPVSYFSYDATSEISPRAPSRAEAGLPEDAFVFCCFDRSYKLNPRIFDAWMRILGSLDGAVLWLMRYNDQAADNLRREAVERGVDPARLVFASRTPLLKDHFARHRLADLFLDTLPFNAHTTAIDALYAGLPVLTARGTTFVGRVAESQLHAIGLADMVADNLEAYEAAALRLARNPIELKAVRDRLAKNRLDHPLFDSARLCRHIEAAYIKMYEHHRRGEQPAPFAVEPRH